MLLAYYDPDRRRVYARRADTGINTAELERLWRKLQPLAIDEMPLDLPPPCTSRIGADAQNRITLSNFQEVRFAVDSPLEETGFEPPVPLLRKALPSAHPRRPTR